MPAATLSVPAPARILGSKRLLARAGDERLVEQIRRGSELAFEVAFERHGTAILAFCRHMLGSQQEAEDAVQHTFASAYRGLQADLEREIALKPWLFAIARNRCISMLRSRRPEPAELEPELGAGLHEEVERRAELRELLADVRELPDDQRAALLLAEASGMSHAEVADVLGCEAERVKALVFRARSGLIERRDARELPCAEIREELANLRGGSLRRNHLRHHLSGCPGCAAYRDEVRRQRRLLAMALPVLPSAELHAKVLAAAGIAGGGAAGSGAAAGGDLAGGAVTGGDSAGGAVTGGALVGNGAAGGGGAALGGALGGGAAGGFAAGGAVLGFGSATIAKVVIAGALAGGGLVAGNAVVERSGVADGPAAPPAAVAPGEGAGDGSSGGRAPEGATGGLPGGAPGVPGSRLPGEAPSRGGKPDRPPGQGADAPGVRRSAERSHGRRGEERGAGRPDGGGGALGHEKRGAAPKDKAAPKGNRPDAAAPKEKAPKERSVAPAQPKPNDEAPEEAPAASAPPAATPPAAPAPPVDTPGAATPKAKRPAFAPPG